MRRPLLRAFGHQLVAVPVGLPAGTKYAVLTTESAPKPD
jgi:hypothetical protein